MHSAPSLLAAALYTIAYLALRRHLATGAGTGGWSGGWPAVAVPCALGALVHAWVLQRAVFGDAGIHIGVFEAASTVCWAAVLGILIGPLGRTLKDLGLALLPLAALAVVLAAIWPASGPLTVHGGPGTRVHVVLSIVAAALLTLAACQGVLLALAEARLTRKRPLGPPGVMPALQVRETLLFQTLWAGFFALSLSLVTGVVFVDDLLGQHLAHKTVLSIAAWAVFAGLLWGRVRHGWRGRTATRWTLSGFVLLGLAYFGSKVILELVLERSWHGG